MKVWLLFILILFLACERIDELHTFKKPDSKNVSLSFNLSKQDPLCTKGCVRKPEEQKLVFSEVDFIASSRSHSFFLSDGLLYGWGENGSQQLWQDSLSYWDKPRLAPSALQQLDLRRLFLGKNFTLALNDEGELFAWGDNTFAQLASHNTKGYQRLDLPVIEQVAVGGFHVLAVSRDGVLYSWGANLVGQLGRPTGQKPTVFRTRQQINRSIKPKRVSHLGKVQVVAAGESHSLALDTQGLVYGWGLSTFGALGVQAVGQSVRVPTSLSSDNMMDAEVVEVPALIQLPEGVTQLAAGSAHSLALIAGRVYSWGLNDQGQLGRANSNAKKYTVYQLKGNGEVKVKLLEVDVDPLPQVVEGLTNIVAISSRGNSSFALEKTGQLYFWGGSFSRSPGTPLYQVFKINQLNKVKDIAAAGNASLLLLDKQNHPFYWGVFRSLQAIAVPQPAIEQDEEQLASERQEKEKLSDGAEIALEPVTKSETRDETLEQT